MVFPLPKPVIISLITLTLLIISSQANQLNLKVEKENKNIILIQKQQNEQQQQQQHEHEEKEKNLNFHNDSSAIFETKNIEINDRNNISDRNANLELERSVFHTNNELKFNNQTIELNSNNKDKKSNKNQIQSSDELSKIKIKIRQKIRPSNVLKVFWSSAAAQQQEDQSTSKNLTNNNNNNNNTVNSVNSFKINYDKLRFENVIKDYSLNLTLTRRSGLNNNIMKHDNYYFDGNKKPNYHLSNSSLNESTNELLGEESHKINNYAVPDELSKLNIMKTSPNGDITVINSK